ncbi:SPRY domain-containing protein [Schizosaccharomyces japonicus yFS275]|uniref:SPRY domain-containing protein n=1 Tax=Schizosaccharomyces japonicus (strain yFS275 / FY16936) TaxID=402676 RepID=B6JYC6_SCHJY|nr:SPRY domain-containing protein [Schizosaccharomyces japonicus yFS275]EEB06544.1 SPRY domain-containing protein [Schizosaccharomyces japonicus yFS275]
MTTLGLPTQSPVVPGDEDSNDFMWMFLMWITSIAIALMLVSLMGSLIYYLGRRRIFLRHAIPGQLDEELNVGTDGSGLEMLSDADKELYYRTKDFEMNNAYDYTSADVSLAQYFQVKEKGLNAWHFNPNPDYGCIVTNKTELDFTGTEESCVTTNLPIPKANQTYYFEAKIIELPRNTLISIGAATKPYPPFRMPGWSSWSAGYVSNGTFRLNQPLFGSDSVPKYEQGDIIGVGYKPQNAKLFFTRNGQRCYEVTCTTRNLYPVIGSKGACEVHVNLGQYGYVYLEGNVKKWQFAPQVASLPAPPSYDADQPSVQIGFTDSSSQRTLRPHHHSQRSQSIDRLQNSYSTDMMSSTTSYWTASVPLSSFHDESSTVH